MIAYSLIIGLSQFFHVSQKSCIMYNRVFDSLTENEMLCEQRFGFQSARSTEHANLQLSYRNSNFFNENEFTLGVFKDFSKAFDTVDHKHYKVTQKEPHPQKKSNVVLIC